MRADLLARTGAAVLAVAALFAGLPETYASEPASASFYSKLDVREQGACLGQAMTPLWRSTGSESARALMQDCLTTSAPTEKLCEGAPPVGDADVVGTWAWVEKGCAAHGGPTAYCQELMYEITRFCASK